VGNSLETKGITMAVLSIDLGGDSKSTLEWEVKKLTSGAVAVRYERTNGKMLYRILSPAAFKVAQTEVAELADDDGWSKSL